MALALGVVYRDARYPASWMKGQTPERVTTFLESRGFVRLDADQLRDWLGTATSSGDAVRAVLVMSQDAAPATVYPEPRADCPMRKFLDAGGRIVWMGDVPFFYRSRYELDPMSPGTPEPKLDPIGLEGQYAVLSSVSATSVAGQRVQLTRQGIRAGLSTTWYSQRPVVSKYLAGGRLLATSKILRRVQIDDIAPQRIIADGQPSPLASIAAVNQIVESTRSIAMLVLGGVLAAALLALGRASAVGPPDPTSVTALAAAVVVTALLSVGLAAQAWYGRYAAAWVERFDNGGEFVRIWDYHNPMLDDAMLEELHRVASLSRW